MRVLAACAPRYYREAIGETLRGLRPAVEVVIVDPEELADGVSHLDPDLVISVRRVRPLREEACGYDQHRGAPPGARRSNVGGSALGGRSGRGTVAEEEGPKDPPLGQGVERTSSLQALVYAAPNCS
jgi:hypothetical protein